ncbi:MAG: phosphate ABC transporter substrate-binding protein [Campylobacterales bacterium]|nr:phosphate ABC transporter substrate-binding protein [Campylobacterales bacterium]
MRILLLVACFVFSLFGAQLTYSGSSTIGQTFFPVLAKQFEQKSSHRFSSIENPGSGRGVAALIAGQTDIAGISSPVSSAMREANLRFFIVGYDAIAVITHGSNPVKSLTMKQLADIFSGVITNWKEVGGKDMEIDVVVEILADKRATQIVFTEIVFHTKTLVGTYAPAITEIDMPAQMAEYVAKTPGAIAPVSMVFAKNQAGLSFVAVDGSEPTNEAIANGTYPISRPLVLLTKENPPLHVKEFLQYVYTKEAQTEINKSFVAAREGE